MLFRSQTIDRQTGTAMRRGVFDNPHQELIPGMFVRIRAPLGEPTKRLMVEERAVSSDQQGPYLLVVNDKKTVEYRPVKLGMSRDGLRVVEQGVTKDDWIIVNGLQRARPGAPVDPQQPDQPPAAETAAATAAPPKPG